MPSPHNTSLVEWLKKEKVFVIVLAVLIGEAVGKLLMRFSEHISTPLLRLALREDPTNVSYVQLGTAKLQVRGFLVSFVEFIFIVVLAYALTRCFR